LTLKPAWRAVMTSRLESGQILAQDVRQPVLMKGDLGL
jgi:hypothetical protein